MGLARRVIPCLDVSEGRVVKGVRFVNLRDAGDPVEAARRYEAEGADELCLLDITASHEGRQATLHLVQEVAEVLTIPLTVGGGVGGIEDFSALLRSGADKVSVNSQALREPALIAELAARFGAQCVVVAIDARREGEGWVAYTHGGRRSTGRDAVAWSAEAAELGAGEILLTSMDADGTLAGYDLPLLQAVAAATDLPLIASGGAGQLADFPAAVEAGADAVLAASLFHDGALAIGAVKEALQAARHEVRIP
ncbi:MAG: imidazole glycerol phosphate synthase subunit HisF [Betaproteobacteria bacterium AqS2]|uniref:Imidazole glycerol phosphate synthase subunit HisF n=1 Tax=Candidatus Amphirhobacter heronislandensis TaxID=1732024 RepID=A0A930UF75_9GAMM|nr:imidazole glycerol phosphate synthase subunit HisF [Betaproteobacteria bacterium AqS2]